MREVYGGQQGDEWLRSRIGRITGSELAKVCSYLTRASKGKVAGEPSAERDTYKRKLIAERLTGLDSPNVTLPRMQWGVDTEDEAATFYEMATGEMVEKVGFVLHPEWDFAGASPDRLVGADGLAEFKCPETTTHLRYIAEDRIPPDYMPQLVWELVCTQRKWVDFVSYDPRIKDEKAKFFCRRLAVEDLAWDTMRGRQVIAYFEDQVLKFEKEIQQYIAERGLTPVAPFPVRLRAA